MKLSLIALAFTVLLLFKPTSATLCSEPKRIPKYCGDSGRETCTYSVWRNAALLIGKIKNDECFLFLILLVVIRYPEISRGCGQYTNANCTELSDQQCYSSPQCMRILQVVPRNYKNVVEIKCEDFDCSHSWNQDMCNDFKECQWDQRQDGKYISLYIDPVFLITLLQYANGKILPRKDFGISSEIIPES